MHAKSENGKICVFTTYGGAQSHAAVPNRMRRCRITHVALSRYASSPKYVRL